MSFFGTVLTCLVTGLHLYVFARLASLHLFGRRLLLGLGGLLWLVFVLGRLLHRQENGFLAELFKFVGLQWMGSLFLLAVALFAVDLCSGFGLLLPQAIALRLRAAALACGLLLALIAHVQGLRPPAVEQYETPVRGLPAGLDGLRIAVLSDLHLGQMLLDAAWLQARVHQVQALHPDCIVLVGDLFERSSDPTKLPPVLRKLTAPLGIFAVRGNHDALRPGRPDLAGKVLAAAGVRLLGNEWTELAPGLVLAGIDDLTASSRRAGEGAAHLARALANRPAGAATILLSHTPWRVEQAAASGVDLMLSGHTHNGQIWPFSCLVRTRYPFFNGQYSISVFISFETLSQRKCLSS